MGKSLKLLNIVLTISICFIATTNTNQPQIRSMCIPTKPKSPNEILEWQNKVRKRLIELLKLPSASEKPSNFKERTTTITRKGKLIIKEGEILSTENRKIKIVLAYPNDVSVKNEKTPAVVCIHGHGGNRWSPFNEDEPAYCLFGKRLAELGFTVISTDIGQHEVYEEGRTLMGERVWDLMRCVDYLSSLPWVNSERIGCAGLSLGGEMAMWLGALDVRIKAVCVSGFLTYMDQMEHNHCMCWKFPGLRETVDFPDIYALIAPRALLCQNGNKEPPDQFPPSLAIKAMEEIKPVYEILGSKTNVELVIHDGGHEIEIESLLAFFKKHLK